MPKYTVILTRDVTESCIVHVEAPNGGAAEDVALAALRGQDAPKWVLDDNYDRRPYVTDVSED